MNCQKANQIDIKKVLEMNQIFPQKMNEKVGWYLALDREEKTPSLKIDYTKNMGYDFGTGMSYDVVKITQLIKRYTVSETLAYLKTFESFSFQKQKIIMAENKYEIIEIKTISNIALKSYLKSRSIIDYNQYIQEIHYRNNDKEYFGIGFKNDSDGYEIRNKYSKICLGKKNITHIQNNSDCIAVFEGYFDFLSFLQIQKFLEFSEMDYLILNSVSLISKTENILKNYNHAHAFSDNDEAGSRTLNTLKSYFPTIVDERLLYSNHKDLNDFLINKSK